MNANFWEHILNAAGHVLDAQRQEREARAVERAERATVKKKAATVAEPKSPAFDGTSKPGGACCTTARRFKR